MLAPHLILISFHRVPPENSACDYTEAAFKPQEKRKPGEEWNEPSWQQGQMRGSTWNIRFMSPRQWR